MGHFTYTNNADTSVSRRVFHRSSSKTKKPLRAKFAGSGNNTMPALQAGITGDT
jgi:hypothetical protein